MPVCRFRTGLVAALAVTAVLTAATDGYIFGKWGAAENPAAG